MDKFKQHIQQNRQQLDVESPPITDWQMAAVLPNKKQGKLLVFSLVKYIAAACILVFAGIGIWHVVAPDKANEPTVAKNTSSNSIQPPSSSMDKDTVTVQPTVKQATYVTTHIAHKKNNIVIKRESNTAAWLQQKPEAINTETATHTVEDALNNATKSFVTVINMQRKKINKTPIFSSEYFDFAEYKEQLKKLDDQERVLRNNIKQQGLENDLLDELIVIYQNKLQLLKNIQKEILKINIYNQSAESLPNTQTYYLSI